MIQKNDRYGAPYQGGRQGGTRGGSYQGGQRGNGPQNGPRGGRDYAPPEPIKPLPMPADYLEKAEELMREYYQLITTSKLRRLFSLVMEVYNEETLRKEETLSADSIAALGLMRIRFAYECGRDEKVKRFVETVGLLSYLKGLGSSRAGFIDFARYMEALVAYHRFFGGREN